MSYKLTPETFGKNVPLSYRKKVLFTNVFNLYNSLVDSEKLVAMFSPTMQAIANEIKDFQDNGAYLHHKHIDPSKGPLSLVASLNLPYHKRKRALFTNLVAFINAAGENEELGNVSVSSTEMDEKLVEYDECLKSLEAAIEQEMKHAVPDSNEPAEDEPTDSNDEDDQDSDGYDYTLAVKFKTDNYLNVGQLQGLEYALKQALSDIADDLGVEVDIINYTIC